MTVILDGHPVPASYGPYLERGAIVAPLDPVVTQFARLAIVDGSHVRIERGSKSVALPAERRGDVVFVGLAPAVRGLGGAIVYDSRHHLAQIVFPANEPVGTPSPFDPAAPSVAPTRIFTPEPVTTPRPVISGSPMPRRTPIPVPPSRP